MWRILIAGVLSSFLLAHAVRSDQLARLPAKPRPPVRSAIQADLDTLHARLRASHDYAAAMDVRIAAQQAATETRQLALAAETRWLTASVAGFLERQAPQASARLMRERRIPELIYAVVRAVDTRHRSHAWIPLSREKAPAFLLAFAFHESSWIAWDQGGPVGQRGERCAWQLHPSTLRAFGYREEQVVGDFQTCFKATLDVMAACAASCGDVPAAAWVSCYAIGGPCAGADAVVSQRFRTARQLLAAR